MDSIGKVDRIIIHHTGAGTTTERDKTTAAGIKRYHVKENNWPDIAYHKVIRGSGLIEAGRSEAKAGAGVKNGNTGALHVCLTGDFSLSKPTTKQLNSLVTVLIRWCRKHKLHTKDIYGHFNTPKGIKKPACPGKNVVSKFRWIKDQVWAGLHPPKYRLSARIKEPQVRRLLERAIDNDKKLSFEEVHQIVFAVIGDGKITQQEVEDLKSIVKYSKPILDERGKQLLDSFLKDPRRFMEHNQQMEQKKKKAV